MENKGAIRTELARSNDIMEKLFRKQAEMAEAEKEYTTLQFVPKDSEAHRVLVNLFFANYGTNVVVNNGDHKLQREGTGRC